MATDEVSGHRIAIGVDPDHPLQVHHPLVEKIDGRHPDRHRLQVRSFNGEQLARAGLEIIAEAGIDFVAPLARLLIGVLPVAEGATGQEVGLDITEAALHAR
jgi:hypothetical protein